MSEAVTVREWTDVVRRARLGRTVTGAALMLATYADYSDGSRVRPGLVRFALDAELSYSTAKEVLATLRRVGLIALVRRGRGAHQADEYRLAIGEQLLDEVRVLSPSEVTALVEETRAAKRRTAGRPGPTGGGVRPGAPAVAEKQGPGAPAVQDDIRPGAPAVPGDVTDGCTAGRTDAFKGCTAGRTGAVRPGAPANTNQEPNTNPNPHSGLDLDGHHLGAAEPATVEDPNLIEGDEQPLPDRCPHRLSSRLRPDGTPSCALCRREVARPSLRLVPAITPTTTRSA